MDTIHGVEVHQLHLMNTDGSSSSCLLHVDTIHGVEVHHLHLINIEMSISVDVNDEPLCHGWYPRVINIEMSISVDV